MQWLLVELKILKKETNPDVKNLPRGLNQKTIKGIKRRNNKGKIRKVTKCVRSKDLCKVET